MVEPRFKEEIEEKKPASKINGWKKKEKIVGEELRDKKNAISATGVYRKSKKAKNQKGKDDSNRKKLEGCTKDCFLCMIG